MGFWLLGWLPWRWKCLIFAIFSIVSIYLASIVTFVSSNRPLTIPACRCTSNTWSVEYHLDLHMTLNFDQKVKLRSNTYKNGQIFLFFAFTFLSFDVGLYLLQWICSSTRQSIIYNFFSLCVNLNFDLKVNWVQILVNWVQILVHFLILTTLFGS